MVVPKSASQKTKTACMIQICYYKYPKYTRYTYYLRGVCMFLKKTSVCDVYMFDHKRTEKEEVRIH